MLLEVVPLNVMFVDVVEKLPMLETLVNFVIQDFTRLPMEDNVNLVQPINTLNLVLVHVLFVVLVMKSKEILVWNVLEDHILLIMDLVYYVLMENLLLDQVLPRVKTVDVVEK